MREISHVNPIKEFAEICFVFLQKELKSRGRTATKLTD